ncbi:uncharacterized protein LOC119179143 isoform X1 [Rhipicephalus microplus]|uniref:uncharacterized protein LOC119179143 isoform X1 n=1 Tax=Rhipicephalus microplus TaxID=6941 RepID=UPI003F6BD312
MPIFMSSKHQKRNTISVDVWRFLRAMKQYVPEQVEVFTPSSLRKTKMKYRNFHLCVTCTLVFFCLGSVFEQRPRGSARYDKAHLVRRILGKNLLLIQSRSIYFRHDYPMCVQSCLIGRRNHVYKREIMYFNKRRKVQMIQGPKIERKAYMRVLRREVDDRPILVVDAFMGRNETDPKVSGRYDIFFASEVCFVMGTPVVDPSTVRYRADRRQAGNSACLLWRIAGAAEQDRVPCRRAFEKYCRHYHGYKFVYRGDICMTITHTEQFMCAIQ